MNGNYLYSTSTSTALTASTINGQISLGSYYTGDPLTYKALSAVDLMPKELEARRETDLAWLKRRVGETCWKPA